MNNIRVVDDIVRQTEELISSFYGDADTAYVFTADHGMSQIGNHGDGRTSPTSFLPPVSCPPILIPSRRSGQHAHAAHRVGQGRARSAP